MDSSECRKIDIKKQQLTMVEETFVDDTLELQYSSYNRQSKLVPEIVEIGEEDDYDDNDNDANHKSGVISRGVNNNSNSQDVFVAVGKDDLEVLRWALAHVVLPGARVNLIHVFPPISYIPTPVGRLWINQLSPEQVKVHAHAEQNRRQNLLNKYIQLCIDTKVDVDTMLIEYNETPKAILDLIPVLNIASLIIGTKDSPQSRKFLKGSNKGILVKKYAPEYCKVTLVYHGKQQVDVQTLRSSLASSNQKRTKVAQQKYGRNSMECRCFPVKFY